MRKNRLDGLVRDLDVFVGGLDMKLVVRTAGRKNEMIFVTTSEVREPAGRWFVENLRKAAKFALVGEIGRRLGEAGLRS